MGSVGELEDCNPAGSPSPKEIESPRKLLADSKRMTKVQNITVGYFTKEDSFGANISSLYTVDSAT